MNLSGSLNFINSILFKAAQTALLADIKQNQKAVVTELSKGDKPSDQTKKAIMDAAAKIARQYHKVEKAEAKA